jgi:phosphohistidine phosphatase SixA
MHTKTLAAALARIVPVAAAIMLAILAPASATEAAWAKLAEGGHVILLRHAAAPGTGDPANFTLGDCATQRNLSADGRNQAQKIGARFASRRVMIEQVLTSQWCRARDTATLAFPRMPIVEEPALNSFFATPENADSQTAALIARIRAFSGTGNIVMVTHQVNITALTGVVPRQGEAVIVKAADTENGVALAGRIIFN